MIEPHVHCAECFMAIPTEVVAKDGTKTDALIPAGQQAFVVPGPEGQIGVGMRQVPVCHECKERLNQAVAASKLIVPGRPELVVV